MAKNTNVGNSITVGCQKCEESFVHPVIYVRNRWAGSDPVVIELHPAIDVVVKETVDSIAHQLRHMYRLEGRNTKHNDQLNYIAKQILEGKIECAPPTLN